MTKSTQQRK